MEQKTNVSNRMYTDRYPRIYAAGNKSFQPNIRVSDCFNEVYSQDVENIAGKESLQFNILTPIRSIGCKDMRNAGPFTESSQLINPSMMSKFQSLVQDLKNTAYKSYWDKEVGRRADIASIFPFNLDNNYTFGKKNVSHDNLYDIIMPNSRSIIKNEASWNSPGHQSTRSYCKDSFNPDIVYGVKSNANKSEEQMKCCLIEDRFLMGTSLKQPIHSAQEKFKKRHHAELGICLAPNNTICLVPEGHAFGKVEPKDSNNVAGCLIYCKQNPERELFFKCLSHLNTVRKCLSKRLNFNFFRDFYLQLKYLDNSLSGWLPKELIYDLCTNKHIRLIPQYIEPMLKMWQAIDDTGIEYETFIRIINFREPLPWLPKVCDIPSECSDFNTTYKDMVMPQQPSKTYMAGIPSGRYFDRVYPVIPDGCCKADRSYLPQESDVKTCLTPSIFTLLGISHRDMYTEREPEKVKRVFKAAGEDMDGDMFDVIWDNATKYHPERLVCYETFRRALNEYKGR